MSEAWVSCKLLLFFFYECGPLRDLHSFPTRRSSDLGFKPRMDEIRARVRPKLDAFGGRQTHRSEEHTSELQSRGHLVCRLLLEKKKRKQGEYREHRDMGQKCRLPLRYASQRRAIRVQ